jgi:hypothetical protein
VLETREPWAASTGWMAFGLLAALVDPRRKILTSRFT